MASDKPNMQNKTSRKGVIRADSNKDRVENWKARFSNLLGQPTEVTDCSIRPKVDRMLEISTEDFTIGELQSCIKSLSNNKAAGLDQILPEVWKSGASTPALLEICNKAMNCDVPKAWTKSCMALTPEQLEICNKVMNGDVFKVWTKSCIVPLPKKGDLGITSNYRGISLTIIAAKINNRLLSNRLR